MLNAMRVLWVWYRDLWKLYSIWGLEEVWGKICERTVGVVEGGIQGSRSSGCPGPSPGYTERTEETGWGRKRPPGKLGEGLGRFGVRLLCVYLIKLGMGNHRSWLGFEMSKEMRTEN